MATPNLFYEETIKSHSSGVSALQRRLTYIAGLRLLAFAGMGAGCWYFIKLRTYPLLIITLFLLSAFIVLVGVYFRLKDRKRLLEKLLYVSSNELDILQGIPSRLADGKEWLDGESYLDDLDIFGPRSLYHLLNRTTTSHGASELAGLLREPLQSITAIGEYQGAVRVLSGQPEARQLLIARGLLSDEKEVDLHSLGDWMASPGRLSGNAFLRFFRWILVVYNLLAVYWYLSTNHVIPLVAGILLGWVVTGYFSAYINRQHRLISKKQAVLDQYGSVISTFNVMDAGDSALLKSLQEATLKANKAMRGLARLAGFFDQRLNMLVNIFFNSLFLYDLQCMVALERWKEQHQSDWPGWIEAVGRIECLNSLAGLAFNNPSFCYPSPLGGSRLQIGAKAMAHPLIPAAARVTNDCRLGQDERLVLVTGSNMSGKTTFLRTIGVNVLLAQCGAPVCAETFSFTPMQLLTSLRVSDSLQEQTSYFMAELKKLQRIVHRLQSGEASLVLIDEILRGTNSEDKTYGSEQFILKLLHYPALSLFATHDLSLGVLESQHPGQISNYCFESIITEGELHFDYRLQKGIARNRNASFLMKKMEII